MERKDAVRAAIRQWVLAAADSHNLSPTKVANRAGLAPSTVLRAIDPQGHNTLSTDSIDKIVRALGIAPPLLTPQNGAVTGFGESEAVEILPTACPAEMKPKTADQSVWRLQTRAVEMPPHGYLPGDLVMLDSAVAPQDGDVVCAQRYDLRRGTAESIWRVYSAPFLYPATTDAGINPKPEFVDNERVAIRGVIVRSLRERR
jgi:DNA-binding phage protein